MSYSLNSSMPCNKPSTSPHYHPSITSLSGVETPVHVSFGPQIAGAAVNPPILTCGSCPNGMWSGELDE